MSSSFTSLLPLGLVDDCIMTFSHFFSFFFLFKIKKLYLERISVNIIVLYLERISVNIIVLYLERISVNIIVLYLERISVVSSRLQAMRRGCLFSAIHKTNIIVLYLERISVISSRLQAMRLDVYLVDWITVTDVAVLETVVCYFSVTRLNFLGYYSFKSVVLLPTTARHRDPCI